MLENPQKKRRIVGSNKRRLFYYFTLLTLTLCIGFYMIYSYDKLFKDFKIAFESNNYSKANDILINKGTFNPLKKVLLNKKLNTYFSSCAEDLYTRYKENEVSEFTTLSILNEIERYNTINDKITKIKNNLPSIKDSKSAYTQAKKLLDEKEYEGAFSIFQQVIPFDENYLKAQEYERESLNRIKEKILQEADELASQNYFTKAISLLEENIKYYETDTDVLNKIDEYKKDRDNFLSKKSITNGQSNKKTNTSSSNSSSTSNIPNDDDKVSKDTSSKAASVAAMVINKNTINTLDLTSETPYLLYVNIAEQKTYVFKGKKNDWNLEKTLLCSTGIKDNQTPKGVFTVKQKGDWFFSNEYNEGGKYWIQFLDNYLFHSLPFDKTKTKVVDTTIGQPASHGCIRLKVSDSKWLYDNIPITSKVIIN